MNRNDEPHISYDPEDDRVPLRDGSSGRDEFSEQDVSPEEDAVVLRPSLSAPAWIRWAQLVRLPAVFTVIAQVVVAWVVAAGDPAVAIAAWPRGAMVLLAAIAIYWSGMILNDLWDFEEDSRERPQRPLPSGQISIGVARSAAWGLWLVSVTLGIASGFVPLADHPPTFAPGLIGVVLAICVVLYNGPLKPTGLAPATMGVCRALCFLLGAAPLVPLGAADLLTPQVGFAPHLLAIAGGFGLYITGITFLSRLETGMPAGGSVDLNIGLGLTLVGAAVLASAPRVAPAGFWMFEADLRYSFLVGLITLPVLMRGLRISVASRPEAIQNVIRSGVLNLIPYSAAIMLLIAGPWWGLAVFGLAIAAMLTARRLRVT